jgi:hypothetical protein
MAGTLYHDTSSTLCVSAMGDSDFRLHPATAHTLNRYASEFALRPISSSLEKLS